MMTKKVSSGWDFKQYVLGVLFYRFISENLTRHLNDKKSEGEGIVARQSELLGD